MKRNLKNLWTLAAAFGLLLGAAGCSKDNTRTDENGPEEGKDTWMKVSFFSPRTYADNPVDGTAEESKIATVDVFVYDAAGTLVNNRQLNDFTESSGVWTSSSTVPAKTGAMRIYVAINLPANVRTAMLGGNISAVTTAEYAVTAAGIATDNKFVMASTIISATLEEWDGVSPMPAANQISAEVTRLAAKFTVEKAAGLSLTGIDGGQINDNMEFGVGQLNTVSLYLKNLVSGVIVGANHIKTFTPGATANGLTGIPAGYIAVNADGLTNLTLKAVYAPENTNDKTGGTPRTGNLTYYAVKANFYPDQRASYTSSALAVTTNVIGNNGSTFYVVKVTDNNNSGESLNLYFYDENEADDFIADGPNYTDAGIDYTITSSAPIEYTDANCYYTVYVNFGYDYDVYRNDFYRSTITKISGLGDPAPGPKDPDVPPVDGRTDIEMSITVEPWNLVSSQDELSPQA